MTWRAKTGGWVLCLALPLGLGCGSRSTPSPDGPTPQPDAATPDAPSADTAPDVLPPDLAPPDLAPDTTAVFIEEFVVSRMMLPDPGQPLGVDLNNDGIVDNALGSILGALAGMGGGSPQDEIDAAVNRGEALLLLRVIAQDLTNDPAATLRTWVGASQACCQSPQDPTLCATQAKQTCFSGSHSFSADPTDVQGYLLAGAISGGAMSFGPGTLRVRFPMGFNLILDLHLKAGHVKGTLAGGTITGGILAGAIDKTELDTQVVPAIASMLNQVLQDPSVSPTTKATITTLFDANGDGQISNQEVANNPIISTFFAGDVDVDNDGVKELSIGLGFEVASAVINP